MTGLERRYRRLMTAYPRTYRREWEDEIVAALLAEARPTQTRPTSAETWDLLSSATAIRLQFGVAERRAGRILAGRIALGSASALVALVVALRLLGITQSGGTTVFALLWTPFVLLILGAPLRHRRARRIGVPVVLGWSMLAVVVGPEFTLIQRTLTAALVLLLVIVVSSPVDRDAGWSPARAVMVVVGTSAGIGMALRLYFDFEYLRGRGAVVMWDALPHPPPIAIPFIAALVVAAVIAAALRPAWSIALGLLLLPLGTVVYMLSSAAFFFSPTPDILLRIASASAGTTALLGVGTIRSMSAEPRRMRSVQRKAD